MRYHSTRKSIQQGEISTLAIVETLLAVALLVTLSIWFDTVKWLAGAICFAPLALLRTEDSVEKGKRWSEWLGKRSEKWVGKAAAASVLIIGGICFWLTGWWALLILLMFYFTILRAYIPLVIFGIRFGATGSSMARHPLQGLVAIPENWKRIVLCTDTATQPEVIPGFQIDLRGFLHVEPGEPELFQSSSFFVIFLYIGAALYQWAVKATSLIYLPLIWLVETARFAPVSIHEALNEYQVSDLRRIRLVLGVGILTAIVIKALLLMTVAEFAQWWESNGALRFLKIFVVPHQIPLWQVASGLNGLLAICLWLYARQVLRLANTNRSPQEGTLRVVWRTGTLFSVVLSLYTIGCTMLITWKEGHLVESLRRLWMVMGKQWIP